MPMTVIGNGMAGDFIFHFSNELKIKPQQKCGLMFPTDIQKHLILELIFVSMKALTYKGKISIHREKR